jgi:hypothetical protein
MGFLDNYEDVNSRIKRFRSEHPTGRLVAIIEDMDLTKGTILIRAEAYREYEDHVPSAVDYAYGNVASLPKIGLLSPSDAGRPTRQDMEKVEVLPADSDPWSTKAAIEDIPTMATAITDIASNLGGQLVAEAPQCSHGHMIWAEGTAKTTGKPWAAYKCTEKNRANQCTPRWYVLASDGKWKPQV